MGSSEVPTTNAEEEKERELGGGDLARSLARAFSATVPVQYAVKAAPGIPREIHRLANECTQSYVSAKIF